MQSLTVDELRCARLACQGLWPRGQLSPDEVCRRLAGVQAQEPLAGALAIRARSSTATRADIIGAWSLNRTIVQTWSLRGTLHFHAPEDLAWLLPLLGPTMIEGARRRMTQLGVTDAVVAEALRRIRRALSHGPLTRAELVEHLRGLAIDLAGQAVPHLLYRAAFERLVCRGPFRGSKETYVLVDDWLPGLDWVDPAQGLTTMVSRYVAAYGPATPRDLAAWSGLPVSLVAPAWDEARRVMDTVEVENTPMLVQAGHDRHELPSAPAVSLLGRFDTYLLGYANRRVADPGGHVRRQSAGGGIIHPAILVDGVVQGTWRAERGRPPVVVTWFDEPCRDATDSLADEVASIERWLAAAR